MMSDSMNIVTATSYMARDIAIDVIHSGHFIPDEYIVKYNLGEGLPNPDAHSGQRLPAGHHCSGVGLLGHLGLV